MGRYNNPSKTKKSMNKGATMMVAIIIIGILMVFAFSLLLVTYTLHASQNKNVASKMNSEAANSLSVALKTELEDEDAEATSDLWRYLRFNVGQQEYWPYYCPELGRGETQGAEGSTKDAYKYFELKTNYRDSYFEQETDKSKVAPDGFPGSIKLGIYWRLPKTVEKQAIADNTAPDDATVRDLIGHNKIRLFIDIICETASQTYVSTIEFELTIDSMTKQEKDKLDKYAEDDRYNPNGRVILSDEDKEEKWIWVSK